MHKVTSELSKKPEKRGMSSNSSKCMTLKQVSLTNHSKSNLSRHNTVFKKSSRQHVCIIWNDASLKERAKRVGRISGESLCLPATLVAPPPPRQHLGEPLGKAQEASLWPWVALIPLNAEEWLGMWRGSSQGAGRPLRLSQVPELMRLSQDHRALSHCSHAGKRPCRRQPQVHLWNLLNYDKLHNTRLKKLLRLTFFKILLMYFGYFENFTYKISKIKIENWEV